MKPISIGFAVVLAGMTLPALQVQAARPADFGTQWVQSHPLTLMALTGQPSKYDATEYQGAGLNTTLSWEQNSQIPVASYNASLPWHYQSDHQPLSQVQTNFNSYYALAPNAQGALVYDEPNYGNFAQAAEHADWFRLDYPSLLTYTNALGYGAFGSAATYETYLQDLINAVQPDVLMYDTYPFRGSQGGTYASYFQNLESVRKVAQLNGKPYWTFIQSFQDVPTATRLPSGSELRMQVFSSLTYGYTGLAYFTYEANFERGLLDAGGEPNAHYYRAAQVNAEVAKLGNTLRKLDSTDVRYVPGRNGPGGVNTNPNPSGTTNWASGAGSDSHILSVLVDTAAGSANIGLGKDGLIGFFKDDANTPYFMLSNLYHGAGLDAEDTNLGFTIQFDGTINSLLLLNRLTGAEDTISLTGNKLTWTLSGGTADLFKYNDGFGFALALSEASNPEPASLAIMALAATALLRRRRIVAP